MFRYTVGARIEYQLGLSFGAQPGKMHRRGKISWDTVGAIFVYKFQLKTQSGHNSRPVRSIHYLI